MYLCDNRCVRVCLTPPILLWLRFAFHGSEEGGGQLTLFTHLQPWVAHFDIDDCEILQMTKITQSTVS